MNLTLIKGLTIMGCRAGEFVRRDSDGATNIAAPRMKQLFEWAESGLLTPFVSHEFPLALAADAMQAVLHRKVVGRVVVNTELTATRVADGAPAIESSTIACKL
jgi:NADPH2:quinone reductase